MNYYNEIDNKAADWLESLIAKKLIPAGTVDRRSIEDVRPTDLDGYTQCHFFAGIGGWPYALQLAGVPPTTQLWTGSCPCQPFSAAGKGKGAADDRHLWPAFHWLISQCRPDRVYGEQVAGKAGESWLDLVSTDLEAEGYACGAAVLPACGVGAPHLRKRLFWVANANSQRCGRESVLLREEQSKDMEVAGGGEAWADIEWLPFRGGKYRPVKPGLMPLVDGLPGRVALIKGYGNAIVPQVAAEFIKAAA